MSPRRGRGGEGRLGRAIGGTKAPARKPRTGSSSMTPSRAQPSDASFYFRKRKQRSFDPSRPQAGGRRHAGATAPRRSSATGEAEGGL